MATAKNGKCYTVRDSDIHGRGEELAYDYKLHVEGRLTKRERAEYACRCGSAKCRGSLLDNSRVKPSRR